ncbi:MAG: hypothetical protein VX899_02730 [Myxococcota bacterium]|nr:hypothetical protein [Myxococcota bacterium]
MLVVYGRALGFGFVYDDQALIADNPALQNWSTLPEALRSELFHFAPGVRPSPYWRPWINLSYYVDHALGGGLAWAFHLHNLLLVWGGGLLLWRLLRVEFLVPAPQALPLSLAWVLHPLLLEPVANIASRPDLWAAFWMLLALQARSRPVLILATTLACLSKELGVLLVPLGVLADAQRSPQERRGDWPFQVGVVVIFVGLRALLVPSSVPPDAASLLEAGHRSLLLLSRVLIPTPLAPAATLPQAAPWLAALSWLLLAGVTTALGLHKRLWSGAVLLLGPVLMVSGVLSAETRYGDGLLTLSVLGAVLLLAEAVKERGVWAARVLWGLPLLGAIHGTMRITEWSDEVTLWRSAHARHPTDPVLRLRLARSLVELAPAEALALQPASDMPESLQREGWEVQGRAHLNLGEAEPALNSLLNAVGDNEESLWAAETACSLAAQAGDLRGLSACATALEVGPPAPGLYNNLGVLLMVAGQPEAGAEMFASGCALAASPDDPVCANAARAGR